MIIRRAEEKDIEQILKLLSQVLEIHAKIRPDIFIAGTTKYKREELLRIINDENTPVFVAVDDNNSVVGYAFCVIENQPQTNNVLARKELYIDDLCVDFSVRGKGIGKRLFEYVKTKAKSLNCDAITLNVWEGNDAAYRFYKNSGLKPKKTLMEYIL